MVTLKRGRKPNRSLLFIGIFLLLVCFGGAVYLFLSTNALRGRLGIILKGDPTVLVSWESDRDRFAVFLLPESMQIEAIHGYGWYGLDALWKLDAIDRQKGLLYRTSFEESLATPIRWHGVIGTAGAATDGQAGSTSLLQRTLSLPSLIRMLLQGQTNIRLNEMVYIWKRIQRLGPDTMTLFDFRKKQITAEVILPDATTVLRFDPERYDANIGNTLEDTSLRQEGIRIALYNTTATPGIAQRLARQIEHMGGFVVFVGNDETVENGMCKLSGTKAILSSRTAQYFRSTFGCTVLELLEGDRADLMVRLGKGIEGRYLPN